MRLTPSGQIPSSGLTLCSVTILGSCPMSYLAVQINTNLNVCFPGVAVFTAETFTLATVLLISLHNRYQTTLEWQSLYMCILWWSYSTQLTTVLYMPVNSSKTISPFRTSTKLYRESTLTQDITPGFSWKTLLLKGWCMRHW